jgi:hypothetical protein
MSWLQVSQAFGNPLFEPQKTKWKRADDFIIEFDLLPGAVTNENRRGVIDARFAKYRADGNSVVPRRIYNTKKNTWERTILHTCGWREIVYEVGQPSIPDGYDSNPDQVRGQGIHFFNTLLAAFWFRITRLAEDIEFSESGAIRKVYWNGDLPAKQWVHTKFGLSDAMYIANFDSK